MDGYVVRDVVVTGRPRPAAGRPPGRRPRGPGDSTELVSADRIVTELTGRPLGHGLSARLEHWRELFAQTTFYLFDPDGWR